MLLMTNISDPSIVVIALYPEIEISDNSTKDAWETTAKTNTSRILREYVLQVSRQNATMFMVK